MLKLRLDEMKRGFGLKLFYLFDLKIKLSLKMKLVLGGVIGFYCIM